MSGLREYHVFPNSLVMGPSFFQIGGAHVIEAGVSAASSAIHCAPTDPMWDDVALLIQAPESGSTIADAKGKAITAQGNVAISTVLGYPTIYFDGDGDRLDVGAAGDFNFMHKGTDPWTLDFIFRPTSMAVWEPIFETARGTSGNAGVWVKFETSKKLTLGIALGYDNGQPAWMLFERTFDHVFVENTEVHVAIDFDISRTSEHGRMYVNGVLDSSGNKLSYTPGTANHQQLMIGMFHTSYPEYAYDGHIRVIRLTKGVRFSAPFTPPAWPFPIA